MLTHAYRGGSMLGTLRPGDRVFIEPAAVGDVSQGDVLAFRRPGGDPAESPLVHRVIVVLPGGLVTRGDNNLASDSSLVTSSNLLGRVSQIERAGALRAVRGGRWGLLRAKLLRWRIHSRALAIQIGRRPYGWLRQSGLAAWFWRPEVRRVRVVSEDGPLVKYVLGGRTIARWYPEAAQFECPPPYDLVVPRPGSEP